MVYNPQQQYGQPLQQQQQYGQPLPLVGQPPEIKWSGLSKGGAFKIPVIAFIGRLTEMVYDTQSTFGLRIVEKYDQVQILESPVPWPWATVELSIKYSDKEDSGWGRHVGSAKTIGLAQQVATLDQAKSELIGKIYEMRQTHENYGEDAKTGQALSGDVWRFTRVVSAGQVQQPYVQPVYVPPVPVVAPAPVIQQQQTGTALAPLLPTDTAPVRAKKLLHGRALNEFLGVALVDPVIKADSAFVNSIFDQSFIVGLKASGQVIMGADGKFQIVA